jgi:hypothetical protein
MIIAIRVGVVLLAILIGIYQNTAKGKANAAHYCTKHVIRKSMAPGGPERLVWVYGPHRTQGNQCDGPEHKRVSGWW